MVHESNRLDAIISNGNVDSPVDHEIDLTAMRSQQFSINDLGVNVTDEQKLIILKRLNLEFTSLEDLPLAATFMIEKIATLDIQEAYDTVKEALVIYDNDPNMPFEEYLLFEKLVNDPHFDGYCSEEKSEKSGKGPVEEKNEKPGQYVSNIMQSSYEESLEPLANYNDYFAHVFDWALQTKIEAGLMLYWSPYPEVRAATDPFDDPSEYCETWRAYVLGLLWVAVCSFINQYFSQRMPGISLSGQAAQILLYPCGLLLSYLPKLDIPVTKNYTFRLNPGPWTTKEQMVSTLMVTVVSTPYIEGPIYVLKMKSFYGFNWVSWGFMILLGLSTQFVGFGLAGIVRKFCIYPSKSVWPTILPTVVMNRALLVPEKKERINGWTMSRYKFFFVLFCGMFVYFWIPNYLFEAISTFNWMTWISPNNATLATITGSVSGMGLNPIPTFDWNVISYLVLPLTIPAFTTFCTVFGSFIAFATICGVWYTNYYWSAYLPINSSSAFDNTGNPYDITAVLGTNDKLDMLKYADYGPPFYTAANLVTYGAFFAAYPFTIIYTVATQFHDIIYAFKSLWYSAKDFHRSSLADFKDPHSVMMSKYKEVPEWVFLLVLVIAIVLGIVCVEIYPTETPVWGIFFTVGINFLFLIPFTVLYSITGYQFSMNVLVELIVGYALPGNPTAHLILKSFGTQTDLQAQDYISNQKIAHYAKIPPRTTFRVQVLATFVNLFICLGVISWQVSSFEGLCTIDQPQKFTCQGDAQIYYTASVIWGVVGPKRVFGGLYPLLRWCFLIGFLLVFPCFAVWYYIPRQHKKWFQPAIIMGGFFGTFAPYNLSYLIPGVYVAAAFMVYIKNRYLAWWSKYNYLIPAAFGSGLALSSIIIFFAVDYHQKSLNWWGNTVSYAGLDGLSSVTLKDPASAPGGYFGPRKGHFPGQ